MLGQVTGYHKGYRGLRHERTVTIYVSDRWVVEDRLISKESHTYRLHWLLPDWEWEVESRDQRVEIVLKSPYGKVVLALQTDQQVSSLHSLVSLARAGEVIYGTRDVLPFEGWVSPTYGVKEPALSLAIEIKANQGVLFLSQFTFPKIDKTVLEMNSIGL